MTYPDNIRAAFREVALGLMEWQAPALMGPRGHANREEFRIVYRPADKQGEVEPFDIDADWRERS